MPGLNQIENVVVPQVAPERTHVYHLYTIKRPRRDAVAAHLNANGVQTAVNYPTALPFLAADARFGHRSEQFPNAFGDQDKILSLPMFAEITEKQQGEVIDPQVLRAALADLIFSAAIDHLAFIRQRLPIRLYKANRGNRGRPERLASSVADLPVTNFKPTKNEIELPIGKVKSPVDVGTGEKMASVEQKWAWI